MSKVINFNRFTNEPKVRYRINIDDRKASRVDFYQNDLEDDLDQYYTIWIDAKSLEEVEPLRLQGLKMLKVDKALTR